MTADPQPGFNEQLTGVLEAFKTALGNESAAAAGVATAAGAVETSTAALERARTGEASAVEIAEAAEAQVQETIGGLTRVLNSWTPTRNR